MSCLFLGVFLKNEKEFNLKYSGSADEMNFRQQCLLNKG
jgi:hypothetical protein